MQKNRGVGVSQGVEANTRQAGFAREPDRGARGAGGQQVIAAPIGENQVEIGSVGWAEQCAMVVLALWRFKYSIRDGGTATKRACRVFVGLIPMWPLT